MFSKLQSASLRLWRIAPALPCVFVLLHSVLLQKRNKHEGGGGRSPEDIMKNRIHKNAPLSNLATAANTINPLPKSHETTSSKYTHCRHTYAWSGAEMATLPLPRSSISAQSLHQSVQPEDRPIPSTWIYPPCSFINTAWTSPANLGCHKTLRVAAEHPPPSYPHPSFLCFLPKPHASSISPSPPLFFIIFFPNCICSPRGQLHAFFVSQNGLRD